MSEWIITSSILIAVVIALRTLFRGKISFRLQYALWGLVLLKLLLPFSFVESPLSVMNIVPDSSIGKKEVYILPLSKEPVTEISGITVDSTGALIDTNSFGYAVLSADGAIITRYAEKMSVSRILTIIWLSGSLVLLLWLIGTNAVFYRRLRQTRRPYPVDSNRLANPPQLPVYVTDQIASPCLFGILRPAVYLTPKAVENEDKIRYALAHELCHYRHGDHIWSILRCVCLVAWWWNPLVWAAALLSREDSELACDEAVIQQIGRENRLAYGYTLVDIIAVRKAPTGLMCAATTMVSGKKSIKGRLNMIIKNPKTFLPALVAVLLVVVFSAGCTFTGAGKGGQNLQEQEFPTVEMVFSSASTDLEQIGREAAAFYYGQFMNNNVPKYWHITKYETLSCQLTAGNQAEFTVWVTSYLETDGAGFLVGQGIPHDPNDLSKGGICPEVGQEFRIQEIDKGQYKIVSVGTGGGTQGLDPLIGYTSYGFLRLERGEPQGSLLPLEGGNAKLAEELIMDHMIKSAAFPGVDIKTLEECYLLRVTYTDDTTIDYYAYLLNGNSVMQRGTDGLYSHIDYSLYEELVRLASMSRPVPKNMSGQAGIPDRKSLSASVTEAIFIANANKYRKADFSATAHTVLKTVENANITTVYVMALYMQFGYAACRDILGLTENPTQVYNTGQDWYDAYKKSI